MNVLGHFCFPSGLRVSVRSMSDAMETAGLLVARRDIRTYDVDDPHHVDFTEREIHDVTVIHAQSDPFFDEAYARADVAERRRRTYRVAYWYWELDTAPASWRESARQVDELWTGTGFVADALRGVTDRPVFTLFPGVRLPPFTPRSRAHFGLPAREDGRFAFLFSFHMDSVMERKNPLGLIASFRRAFGEDEPVDLVLKTTSFGNYDAQLAELAAAAGTANVHDRRPSARQARHRGADGQLRRLRVAAPERGTWPDNGRGHAARQAGGSDALLGQFGLHERR